jgi:excalibur calcium-binding domain-containing protein
MLRKTTIAMSSVALGLGVMFVGTAPAQASAKTYKNCTALNKVYKHGVGRPGAKDHTSGKPVTNFKVSKSIYDKNKKSDRDKDGIACEKR